MYDGFDFEKVTEKFAHEIILLDRRRYYAVYKLIVDFLRAASEVYVGSDVAYDAFGARTLKYEQVANEGSMLILYSRDPFKTAENMIRDLVKSPELPAALKPTMLVACINEDYEYNLSTEGRRLCVFKFLGDYRGIPLVKLITPARIEGVSIMSADVLLIDLYRRLFVADEDRSKLIKLEARLFDRFLHDAGGDEYVKKIKGTEEINIVALRKKLLSLFPVHVIVGPQAFAPTSDMSGMEIVVDKLDGEIVSILEANADGCKVNRYLLSLPVDSHLRRFRVVAEVGGRRQNVIDVFNAGNYDLIHRSHPFVLFRFALVDIWTMRLICGLGEMDKSVAEKQIDRLVWFMKEARKKHGVAMTEPVSEDFIGTYVDEGVASRRDKKHARRNNAQFIYGALI